MASPSRPATAKEPEFHPYIPAGTTMRECTPRAIILGAILGVVFGASSLYLVLKVGLTVSASIPVAVISLALFRLWSKLGGRDATILENNIVQTAGSAGESIAFGLGVTMPAIMILGFDLEMQRVLLVGLLGALLGILMMIPLRRALIVKQHGLLKYPEGTACAEVLKAGANAESRAMASEVAQQAAKARARERGEESPNAFTIFTGFGIGLLYKTAMDAFKLWKDSPAKILGAPLKGGLISAEISPELLGVGYIIGPRTSCIMMAGGILSSLVLMPLIKFFGEGLGAVLPPGRKLISEMGPDELRGGYILYIGAGAVATGGIISLIRSLPIIFHGVRSGLTDFHSAIRMQASFIRTDLDLSMKVVAGGVVALIVAIYFAPSLHINLLSAVLIVIFGFLFVTVSSRVTGEIGSSSNPLSGMIVATLLLTCLCFLAVGWTGGIYYVTALSVGGIVCVAASNAGGTSQDLKTGFLLGATPRFQQIAILIGATLSALTIGPILLSLNSNGTVYVPIEQVAPGLHAPAGAALGPAESLHGRQSRTDTNAYQVWQKTDDLGAPAGKYLVADGGTVVWLVDPAINGVHKKRPDGTSAQKFDAPKARLMSYIIKGMLDRKLPWSMVSSGIMIAVVLELCGVSSLAFAVGLYLPISSSAPVFIGGLVRWLVDNGMRRDLRHHDLAEDELVAEADKSPGVLLASGYIAGGAIAGILIAFVEGVTTQLDESLTKWAEAFNPFYAGPNADWLALIPFAALAVLLYLTGRKLLLAGRPARSSPGVT